MPNEFDYFPMFYKDFASDAKVEAMTTEEVGAYFLLLCKAWTEDPPGSIPSDDAVLARWARMDPVAWSVCKPRVLAPFTSHTEGRLIQRRMAAEYRTLAEQVARKRRAGKKGAEARWKGGTDGKRNATASEDGNRMRLPLRSHCDGNASRGLEHSSSTTLSKEVSFEGGAGGNKNAVALRLPSENPIFWLGRLWEFHSKRTRNGCKVDKAEDAEPFMEFLLAKGFTLEFLENDIKTRADKTEWLDQFKRRLMATKKDVAAEPKYRTVEQMRQDADRREKDSQ